MALERQVVSWDRHKNVLGLNQLRGPHPSPSDNFITNKIRYSRTLKFENEQLKGKS
jgi:hypothetical protein